jgi:hypothetical protein
MVDRGPPSRGTVGGIEYIVGNRCAERASVRGMYAFPNDVSKNGGNDISPAEARDDEGG